MRALALCSVVILLGACTRTTPRTSVTNDDSGPTMVAPIDASGDVGAREVEDAATDHRAASLPLHPLPPIAEVAAPFGKAKRRGFVAVTNGRDRASTSFVAAEPLDGDRPVLVASFTKLWTAVAALRLVRRNLIRLEDTIADVLPVLGRRPWAKSMLRELLTHTSLVPEFDDKTGYYRLRDVDFAAPTEILAKYVPADWSEKRGVYKYRNAELALVGAMLAARAKEPAATVLSKEVFEPAKMTHSGLLAKEKVAGLDLAPMGPVRPQNFFTAGAGYASANDLLAFFEALATNVLLTDAEKGLLFEASPERGQGALACWAFPFAAPDGGTTLLVERPGSFGNVRLQTVFVPSEGRAVIAWSDDGIEIARPRIKGGLGAHLATAIIK